MTRTVRRLAPCLAAVLLLLGLPAVTAGADEPRDTQNVCEPPYASDFPDSDGSAHEDNIRCMADHGIAEGRADGTYGPRARVRRDQMASFIARFIEAATDRSLPEGDPDRFDDVPDDNVHAAAINALAEAGVVEGRGGREYAPREVVRRDAMASFIRRAASYLDDENATNGSQPPSWRGGAFADVPDGNVHADNIDALAGVGIVAGFGDGTYRPREPVLRDQMASFVMRGYDYAAEQDPTLDTEDDGGDRGGEQPEDGGAGAAWADPDSASITPGVRMVTGGGQCTANFVFTGEAAGSSGIYLGYAAHCAMDDSSATAATNTNGCEADSRPLGTPVEIEGASEPGRLVYSSWVAMRERNEADDSVCAFNDFALVALHPDDHHRVNPTLPYWGGPDAMSRSSAVGETVHTYGNSDFRLGLATLSPKEGYIVAQHGDGWNHQLFTATPGVPGDSGSAVLDETGRALATLSTVAVTPLPASNGAADIGKTLAYANQHGGVDVSLAPGTESFGGGLLLP